MINEGTFSGGSGAKLYYRMYKPQTTPKATVIVVHGLGDHSGGLHNLLQPLSDHGYTAYAFDLRGHGRSSGTRGFIRKWDDYREDLHEFCKLVESKSSELPLYLVVHSLGGVIGLDYILHHHTNFTGMVAIAPAISYEVSLFEKIFISLVGVIKPDFTLKTSSKPHLLSQDTQVLARIQGDQLRHQMVTPGLGRGLLETVPRIMRDGYSIKLPFLLLYGLDDEITPPQKLREFYHILGSTDKQLYEYKISKHRPFEDIEREQFFKDLLSWFDRQGEIITRKKISL